MKNFFEYLKEREGFDAIVKPDGFAIFKFTTPEECYIKDIFVRPSKRKTKLASEMADEISKLAKERGCSHLTGTVSYNIENADRSIRVLLGYGFSFLGVNPETKQLIFTKGI